MEEPYWESMGECGTHSVIDVISVTDAAAEDQDYQTIRPLTAAESHGLFGTDRPNRDDYDRFANTEAIADLVTGGRWTGRSVVLWADNQPAQIAIWGYSGD